MSTILSTASIFCIPLLISTIILFGLKKKASIYDLFVDGAKEGISTTVEMLPFIIAIFIGIEAITSSGALEWIEGILAPFFSLIHVPKELLSLILLRPVSGSGSLVLAERIMEANGTDTFIGRSASVMVGSCETVFYVLALYFGVTKVKKMRHAVVSGLLGYLAGIIASIFFCRLI
ncbi:MAG: spore maturation protein [Anaerovoracaceae bacterium]